MSKRRHRHRDGSNSNVNNGMNNINNNPFGINPMQLMNMMGNVDMAEISRIISTMNGEGFDFNNLNLNSIQSLLNRNVTEMNNNLNGNFANRKEETLNNNEIKKDENIEMLMNLRNIVDVNRVVFIDKIIELYKRGIFEE